MGYNTVTCLKFKDSLMTKKLNHLAEWKIEQRPQYKRLSSEFEIPQYDQRALNIELYDAIELKTSKQRFNILSVEFKTSLVKKLAEGIVEELMSNPELLYVSIFLQGHYYYIRFDIHYMFARSRFGTLEDIEVLTANNTTPNRKYYNS
jgi:hypothetical protein